MNLDGTSFTQAVAGAKNMRTKELIASDLYRYHGRTNIYSFVKAYMMNRGLNYMVWFRLANSKNPIVSFLASKILRLKQNKYGIIIPAETKIGAGFYIGHNGPCVINPTATIGSNVNISQFVTIGSNFNKAATIGDNVYIGPNCVLVEDITIGNNVTIGAGSVVVKSIPDDQTAAGNPAKILNSNNAGRFIKNRWPV